MNMCDAINAAVLDLLSIDAPTVDLASGAILEELATIAPIEMYDLKYTVRKGAIDFSSIVGQYYESNNTLESINAYMLDYQTDKLQQELYAIVTEAMQDMLEDVYRYKDKDLRKMLTKKIKAVK